MIALMTASPATAVAWDADLAEAFVAAVATQATDHLAAAAEKHEQTEAGEDRE